MKAKLGPTGLFPDGKLSEDDMGELQIAVGIADNCVAIDFGPTLGWIAMPPDDAVSIANCILAKAKELME